ncbi:MFS transporter [Streptomyces niveiscabiei]|uniref:MFS transporter n=1 Tax=Streptomyces niveiscabiei TaxID=164115 RepID=UPI0029A9C58F|nr:MFS transporter [Streptomyces niveiscabiei]MDX3384620.1 MFS transporter [Streptomyces niveiscabiei]
MANSPSVTSRWLLPVVLTVQFLVSLDLSVVNVALPAIRVGLGFGGGALSWVVNAYALAFGGLLMLGGRLADVVGRRRVLIAGFAVFGGASLGGGLALEPWQLIAARVVQGVGAAGLAPVALALVTVNFPAGAARSRALGLWGAAGAAGGAVGVLAGGLLTDWVGWRAVMLVNVPVVLGVLAVVRRAVPADGRTGGGRLDLAGALLVTGGTGMLVLGSVRTETYGWGDWRTAGGAGLGLVLLAGFVAAEARVREPLLRPGLLRGRPVLAANVFTLLLSAGQFGTFYFTSLHLQQVRGYGPTATGVSFLPFCAAIVLGTALAPRLLARFGAGRLMLTGGLLGAAGIALFALTVSPDGTFWRSVLLPQLVAGLGIGLSFVPLGSAATEGVPAGETGMASGLLNSSRQVGGAVGLAVLVGVSAGGFAAAYWAAAGALGAGAVAAGLLYRPYRRAGRGGRSGRGGGKKFSGILR